MPRNFDPVKTIPNSGQWSKADLIDHVKTGMQIELSTLPLYFCAYYSIKPGDGSSSWPATARLRILTVVEQEMLHLSLVGNMLRALDGIQVLYNQDFIPQYPSKILYSKIPMELRPADKKNLDCFLKIEAPYMPPVSLTPETGTLFRGSFAPEYHSIGQFYDKIKEAIIELCEDDPNLFTSNKGEQFNEAEFFNSKMTVIVDEQTALEALSTIVDQGEGSIGVPDSHYSIFVNLYQNLTQWDCVNYIDEPKTEKYKANQVAYRLSLAVNASYCYLLQTIDTCWKTEDQSERIHLVRKLHKLMIEILSPCAYILVKQIIVDGDDKKYAAPCFEYYPLGKSPLPADQLLAALKDELKQAYNDAAGDSDTQSAIQQILDRIAAI
ncbi:hypothetical protein GYMLUDRAFT_72117 [Collybiopsis luxurians FD-317 M1]|uniref:Unplaced genomic scaffold GYMLUscaffold_16, whole genome shotgun sequence n=1 Tax=Collybiopsis luxurians FD-317 M1 TaxID=944289 RepID=A0A0D0C5P7_9AGAR|nr:hypothetical protein GYMLUDRAFT_72117 [Collybiopsis luxurians FD-317 M1]